MYIWSGIKEGHDYYVRQVGDSTHPFMEQHTCEGLWKNKLHLSIPLFIFTTKEDTDFVKPNT